MGNTNNNPRGKDTADPKNGGSKNSDRVTYEKYDHIKNRIPDDYKKVKTDIVEGARKLKVRTDESARHMSDRPTGDKNK